MIGLFYIYENADTKASDTRMQVIPSLDQNEGERGKGIFWRSSHLSGLQKKLLKCVINSYQNLLEWKEF